MLSSMNTGAEVVPAPGLLAGIVLSTTNTASVTYPAFDDAPAYLRLIVDALNTSNTMRVARAVEMPHTDAGPAISDFTRAEPHRGFRARDAIFELRRLTGLTWDELAKLLRVNRRSLHLWANGQPINAPNETRLRDLVSAMRVLDRGTARENRALLISPRPEGVFSDLLRDGRFDEAQVWAERGKRRLSPAGRPEAARPQVGRLSVADTFSTRADRVHTDDGVALLRQRRPR
jgi:hypothetical protein